MSIEKPQNEESADTMKIFREKVRHLIEDEARNQQTAHFSYVDSTKEFLDSLTEEDKRWLDFVEEAQAIDDKLLHFLPSSKVKEYEEKIEEFKEVRKTIKGSRAIWYEFIANKLNVAAFKLFRLQTRRGANDPDDSDVFKKNKK